VADLIAEPAPEDQQDYESDSLIPAYVAVAGNDLAQRS